jgi:hypothetical protein
MYTASCQSIASEQKMFTGAFVKKKIPLAPCFFRFWRQKEPENLEQRAMHEKREEKAQFQAAGTQYRNRKELIRLLAILRVS